MKYSVGLISAASTMRLVSFCIVRSCAGPVCFLAFTAALVEALWKQEGENRGASLRKTEWAAGGCKSTKHLKIRNKRKLCAMLRTVGEHTHNLKVTGSNPVPATK